MYMWTIYFFAILTLHLSNSLTSGVTTDTLTGTEDHGGSPRENTNKPTTTFDGSGDYDTVTWLEPHTNKPTNVGITPASTAGEITNLPTTVLSGTGSGTANYTGTEKVLFVISCLFLITIIVQSIVIIWLSRLCLKLRKDKKESRYDDNYISSEKSDSSEVLYPGQHSFVARNSGLRSSSTKNDRFGVNESGVYSIPRVPLSSERTYMSLTDAAPKPVAGKGNNNPYEETAFHEQYETPGSRPRNQYEQLRLPPL